MLDTDATSAKVEIYDPATDTWSTGPDLPTPRGGLGAAVLDGQAYVVGGETTAEALSTVEALDLATQSWTPSEALPTPRHGAGVVSTGGRVWVIGGADVPAFGAVDIVESFAP